MSARPILLPPAIAALWLALGPAPARADSATEQLAAGRLQFEYKNFEKAIELLADLLHPEVELAREEDIVAAREMLGLAYFYTGREEAAREEFKALLYLEPKHRLDPFLVPPPAVQFFDAIRQDPELKTRLEQIERERREAAEQARRSERKPSVVRRIYLERTSRKRWRVLAFMPFGLGQFQNDDDALGIVMASTQGLALLTNAVCWTLRWTLEEPGGGYRDPSIARGLQIGQYSALGVFAGLYLWSVIDANLAFEPLGLEPFQRVREEEQPVEEPAGGPDTSLAPTALPGGAGLQLQMRF